MKKSFLILLVLCSACIKPEEPPANIIPKDTMALLLIDVHVAEAKVTVRPMQPDTTYTLYKKYKEEIYRKYKVKPERFQESFDFYARNLKEMNEIYEVVVDSLSLMEGRGKLD